MSESPPIAETEAEPGEEQALCTACVRPNDPNVNFCVHCGAPVNDLVGYLPYEQILMEGFAYRRAVDGPPSKIVLWGIWVIFAPSVLASLLGVTSWPAGFGHIVAASGLFGIIILYRATANYRAKRRQSLEAESNTG